MKVRHLKVSMKKKVHGCMAWWEDLTNLLISTNFQFCVVPNILLISRLSNFYVIFDSKGLRIVQKKCDKHLLKTNVSLLVKSSNTPSSKPKQYSQSSLDTLVCKHFLLRPPFDRIWPLRLHETFLSVAISSCGHLFVLSRVS